MNQHNSKDNWLRWIQQLCSQNNLNTSHILTKESIKQTNTQITKQIKAKYEEYWFKQINEEKSKTNKGNNKLRTYKSPKSAIKYWGPEGDWTRPNQKDLQVMHYKRHRRWRTLNN